ncbi:MAG: beta-N-acetylhexosaminidase [Panacagrimonas sp.]|jgi:beta-N-acetylhexosaminidase|nr:beta-N-acetylhexosaminidase [Panacagrimonas sp.]MCC2655895.1 beta-N-acetylhexosaminidase [Panacagrimonas sp.]
MPGKAAQGRIGPLMLDVGGLELNAEDRDVLAHPLVGGVILFTRNYRDPDQLRALCANILAIKRSPRLLLAVDHEGGRVQRFRVGFSRIPAMRTLGKRYEESAKAALDEAANHGFTIGTELGAFGIDLCFAPVLDRDIGVSGVIGDRAFATKIDEIVELARAFRSGLNRAGMAATGKHFPGHGAVAADSHLELPVDRRSLGELERTELAPFRPLIEDGIESLMMAHVRYTAVDQIPASLSRKWIAGTLRRKLRYRGAVFCDDLSMNGAAVVGTMAERAQLALASGCDMLPVCNDRPAAIKLIEDLRDVPPSPARSRRLASLFRTEGPR